MIYDLNRALIITKAARKQKLKFFNSDNIGHASQIYVGLTKKQGEELYLSCLRNQTSPYFEGFGESSNNNIIKIDDVLFYWPKEEKAA